jgi:hypothetical protein
MALNAALTSLKIPCINFSASIIRTPLDYRQFRGCSIATIRVKQHRSAYASAHDAVHTAAPDGASAYCNSMQLGP